ncbi:hypothetical protein DMUE_1897 [Dictyocoela muelleri]|nr:hypothetical protein DMUE_1897 [Dictyocoela muelleri]
MKLELSKYFKKDFKSVYESIITTESMLIENIQHTLLKENDNFPNQDNYNEKKHHSKQNKTHNKNMTKKKYCTFHKSHTHYDEYCRAKNESKKTDKNNKG